LTPCWYKLGSGEAGGSVLVQAVFRWSLWPSAGRSCFPVDRGYQRNLTQKSNCFNAAPAWLLCFSGGSAFFQAVYLVTDCGLPLVQAAFRWLPVAQRWLQLFSGGCRWPRCGVSLFPVRAGGLAVVQRLFRCLPLLPAGCRWLRCTVFAAPIASGGFFSPPGASPS